MKTYGLGNVGKTRLFYPDGRIVNYNDPALALAVYYGLSRGIRAAFRGAGDETPIYPHDYVNK